MSGNTSLTGKALASCKSILGQNALASSSVAYSETEKQVGTFRQELRALMWRLRYAVLCARRLPVGFIRSPGFALQITTRRFLYSITRRFCGASFASPITGERIFNTQSLINCFAMQIVRELDGPWQQHVREAPAPVVLDVGSNIGQFRALVLSLNPGAQVWTVDAWPAMARYVPGDHHTCTALAETEGTARLQFARVGWTASTMPAFYDGPTLEVRTRTLDSLWKELGSPEVDLLKIDVDGAEERLLQGAKEVLAHTKYVLIETERDLETLCPGRTWETVNAFDYCGHVPVVQQAHPQRSNE